MGVVGAVLTKKIVSRGWRIRALITRSLDKVQRAAFARRLTAGLALHPVGQDQSLLAPLLTLGPDSPIP